MFLHNWHFYLPFLFVVQSHQPVAALVLLRKLYHLDVCPKIRQKLPQAPQKQRLSKYEQKTFCWGILLGIQTDFLFMDVWSLMVLFVIKCCWFARFHSFNKIQRFTCFFRFTKMGPNLHEVFLHCRLPASDFSVVATSHNEQKGWEVEIVGDAQAWGFGDDFWGEDWLFQILKTCYTDCLLFVTYCCLSVRFSYFIAACVWKKRPVSSGRYFYTAFLGGNSPQHQPFPQQNHSWTRVKGQWIGAGWLEGIRKCQRPE